MILNLKPLACQMSPIIFLVLCRALERDRQFYVRVSIHGKTVLVCISVDLVDRSQR